MDKIKLTAALVKALDGPTAVARIFHVNPQAVSYWLRVGIPDNRLGQFRDLFPKLVRRIESELACSQNEA